MPTLCFVQIYHSSTFEEFDTGLGLGPRFTPNILPSNLSSVLLEGKLFFALSSAELSS